MFRSARRDVVFPQAEHARLAGALALAWGNERFTRPALPSDSFVRGVTLHDRGYGLLDEDEIGRMEPSRWAQIQLQGFMPAAVIRWSTSSPPCTSTGWPVTSPDRRRSRPRP